MSDYPVLQYDQAPWFPKVVYALSAVVLVSFGLLGTYLALRDTSATRTVQQFISATRSSGLLVISFAFFGPILGVSGLLIVSSNIVILKGGWQQVVAQSLYPTLGPIVVALCGLYLIKTNQDVVSFVHFLRYRFGIASFILTLIIMLYNMASLLLQEYLSIAAIFVGVVDPNMHCSRPDVLITVLVAGIVAIYTALGGLKISLITDLFQCGLTLILAILLLIYVGVTFRYPLTRQNFDALSLGRHNVIGSSSFAVQLQAVFFIFYSEGNWQRVWASKNNSVLIWGAVIGGLISGFMAFIASVCGLLSLWANLPQLDPLGNLALFTVFEANLSSWAMVLFIILLVSLAESFVDSLQNGMLATVTTIYVTIKEQIKYNKEFKDLKKREPGVGFYGLQNKLEQEFTKISIDYNEEPIKQGHFINSHQWYNSFKRTAWVRLVVICFQIILVPVAIKGFNLIIVNYVSGIVVTILFSSQILALFVSPKYFNQYHSFVSLAISFFSPYVYTRIVLPRPSPEDPTGIVDNNPRNVFKYVWNVILNQNDYGVMLTILISGLVASFVLICGTILYQYFRGNVKRENLYRDIFIYNAKHYYLEQMSGINSK